MDAWGRAARAMSCGGRAVWRWRGVGEAGAQRANGDGCRIARGRAPRHTAPSAPMGSPPPPPCARTQTGPFHYNSTVTRGKIFFGTVDFSWVRLPSAPGIQISVLVIYPNASPPNITPSSSPGHRTPAVSGAHVWAEWLHHPCLLGGPQQGDKKWEKRETTGRRKGKRLPGAPGALTHSLQVNPPPLCDIPSGCCSFTGPWTVTRSSVRMLRRVTAFCRPLRPVLLLVSFPRSRSPVVGVLGLC